MKKFILITSLILLHVLCFAKTYPKGSTTTPRQNQLRWDEEHAYVFKDVRFRYIDSIAITTSYKYPNIHKDSSNINLLVKMLTKDCHNDIEKYRALFVWQMMHTRYDDNYSDSTYDWRKNDNWYTVFNSNSGVCAGRAGLYVELCHRAGLNCEWVMGNSHAWCIILYNKNYYMIETCVNCDGIIISHSFDGFMFNPYDGFIFPTSGIGGRNVDHTKLWIQDPKKMYEVRSNIYAYAYETPRGNDKNFEHIYKSKYGSRCYSSNYLYYNSTFLKNMSKAKKRGC